jgi:hypothetical protein
LGESGGERRERKEQKEEKEDEKKERKNTFKHIWFYPLRMWVPHIVLDYIKFHLEMGQIGTISKLLATTWVDSSTQIYPGQLGKGTSATEQAHG